MIGLHHRAHSTRVARTVEKTFVLAGTRLASRAPPPHPVPTHDRPAPTHRSLSAAIRRTPLPITDSGHAGAGDRETDRAPACFNSGSPPCRHSSLPVPRTYTSQDSAAGRHRDHDRRGKPPRHLVHDAQRELPALRANARGLGARDLHRRCDQERFGDRAAGVATDPECGRYLQQQAERDLLLLLRRAAHHGMISRQVTYEFS